MENGQVKIMAKKQLNLKTAKKHNKLKEFIKQEKKHIAGDKKKFNRTLKSICQGDKPVI